MFQGIDASPGIGVGEALVFENEHLSIPVGSMPVEDELEHFNSAVEAAKQTYAELVKKAESRTDSTVSQIFEAYIELLEDEDSVIQPIKKSIESGWNAAKAVYEHFNSLVETMRKLEDNTLRERAADFAELRDELVRKILGIKKTDMTKLDRDVILFAYNLTPADTVLMDMAHVKGIVTEIGGRTSHTAILANAMYIPAVVGCSGAIAMARDGVPTIIDGSAGTVILQPDAEQRQSYITKKSEYENNTKKLDAFIHAPTLTKDGQSRMVCANVASAAACADALRYGCDGVGLLRSEFLYMESDSLPDEETQYGAYAKALETLKGHHVTIRTLDAGGDKGLEYLHIPPEANPFMGYRAIRICLDRREIFITQLRAMLRASIKGELHIMFPMISSMEEFRAAKATVLEARDQLTQEGIAAVGNIKIGLMIEVPSAAIMSDALAKEADFFSIGTNDLTQYTTAVDRGNEKLQKLYTHYNPGVIRLIAHVIRSAHEGGIPCCMCGEAAGDIAFVPALLGMGLDEFSVPVSKITRVRKLLSELSYHECEQKVQALFDVTTVEQAKAVLTDMLPGLYRAQVPRL